MSIGASSKIEEFEISVEDGSEGLLVPPSPPAAPKLVVLVPREYEWKLDFESNHPGLRIECWRKDG
jgi:hypothetical protein